jgi:hypothetical protein
VNAAGNVLAAWLTSAIPAATLGPPKFSESRIQNIANLENSVSTSSCLITGAGSPTTITPALDKTRHLLETTIRANSVSPRPSSTMAAAAMRPSMGALGRISIPSTPATLGPLTQAASLSTSAALLKRHKYVGARDNKDHNKKRGESAIRRTGTRWRLSMSDEPLPKPVPREQLPAIETDPDHGLWDFFYDRNRVVNTPEADSQHGRSWTVEELRHKSWDDLHRLWWVCVKERNRIATANWERHKANLGFGEAEATKRDFAVSLQ